MQGLMDNLVKCPFQNNHEAYIRSVMPLQLFGMNMKNLQLEKHTDLFIHFLYNTH